MLPIDVSDLRNEDLSGADDEAAHQQFRFKGSAIRYKQLTRPERLLNDSLKRLDDRDLSIHLYNVFSIKRKLYHERLNGPRNHESKRRWLPKNDWTPSKSWTLWPLDANSVPRPQEEERAYITIDNADRGRNNSSLPYPRSWLEEVAMTRILKRARQKFKQQQKSISAQLQPTDDDQAQIQIDNTNNNPRSQTPPGATSMQKGTVQHGETQKNPSKEMLSPSDLRKLGINVTLLHDAETVLDDSRAERIARPAVQQLLEKVQSLLLALHRSRENHILLKRKSEKDITKKRYEASTTSFKGLRRPNPRDWSEIIGLAASTGWGDQVIESSYKRCADIFGEAMDFKSMQEEKLDPNMPVEDFLEPTKPKTIRLRHQQAATA